MANENDDYLKVLSGDPFAGSNSVGGKMGEIAKKREQEKHARSGFGNTAQNHHINTDSSKGFIHAIAHIAVFLAIVSFGVMWAQHNVAGPEDEVIGKGFFFGLIGYGVLKHFKVVDFLAGLAEAAIYVGVGLFLFGLVYSFIGGG